MSIREKLIELLAPTSLEFEEAEYLADYLVKNGVMVQEWISVKDRLPEDSGYYLGVYKDKLDGSISIAFDMYVKCKAGEWWENDFMRDVTHWMPLPHPPKGE